jgi:hypothetical protein
MKKLALSPLFFLLLFLSSCTSKFEETNEQALQFAANDKRIGQKEYETLVENIKSSDERGFQTFKTETGEVDHAKVSAYLVKYFAAKGVAVAPGDIWQPNKASTAKNKFNVNVFLENSASMDGYVNTSSTAFKASILDLLTNIKNFAATGDLNLSYINSAIIPVKVKASENDITTFYQNLNTASFRSQGGMRGSSDMGQMLSQILNQSDRNNLSVFISDFVFSPRRTNAINYLQGQRSQIRSDFLAAKRRNPDLSVAILQGKATFQGTYYDQKDQEHRNLNAIRPYYVWLIGNASDIQQIIDLKILDQTRNSYTNKLVIQSASAAEQPTFKILYSPKIGQFDAKSLAKGIINDAKAASDDRNKGVFEFNVAVNFGNSMQDDGYFKDSTNYFLSDKKYSLKVKPVTDKNDMALNGYTHILTLRTNELKEGQLLIEVRGKVPHWVYSSTSDNDTAIKTDASQANKTFGFSYLVEGVADAFYPQSQPNTLYKIPLSIKK